MHSAISHGGHAVVVGALGVVLGAVVVGFGLQAQQSPPATILWFLMSS
jgi:hypothetical protein